MLSSLGVGWSLFSFSLTSRGILLPSSSLQHSFFFFFFCRIEILVHSFQLPRRTFALAAVAIATCHQTQQTNIIIHQSIHTYTHMSHKI